MSFKDLIENKIDGVISAFFESKGMPSKAHVMAMCKDGMSFADMCKMHPEADKDKLKALVDKCKEQMKEATEEDSNAEIDDEMIGKICQCCDNKITADGCGCDETCKHCGGMGKAVENEQKEAKLDPVGKADADIDNDGDVDSTDDYLKNRRKKISKAIDAKKLKEMAKASKINI